MKTKFLVVLAGLLVVSLLVISVVSASLIIGEEENPNPPVIEACYTLLGFKLETQLNEVNGTTSLQSFNLLDFNNHFDLNDYFDEAVAIISVWYDPSDEKIIELASGFNVSSMESTFCKEI